MECDDHVTSADSHVMSCDPSTAVFDVVEEPVDSVVRTQSVKQVPETDLTSSEEQVMETEATTTSSGDVPVIRSFTPPPNSIPSDSHSQTTKRTETQEAASPGDDTIPLPSEGGEGDAKTKVSVTKFYVIDQWPPNGIFLRQHSPKSVLEEPLKTCSQFLTYSFGFFAHKRAHLRHSHAGHACVHACSHYTCIYKAKQLNWPATALEILSQP